MTKIINNNNRNPNHQNNHKHKNHQNPSKQQTYDLKCLSIQQLYDLAQQFYNQLKNDNKNDKWNQFIAQKGTKKDKITFVAAEILKKPEASLEHFQLLAKWTLDVNHNFALPACQALSNIYIDHVFVQKPILKVFLDSVQQYIKNNKKDSKVAKGDLIGFYLQHHIKHYYGQMIRGVTQLLTSTITHIKKTSIQILASLSRFKQLRRTILSTLINKFGDSDMQVVNQVTKSLKAQFYQDIQASQTLLEQAEAFLFRQHLSQKSQFYVINFLNNVNLKYFSQKSLTKLFELFFHFFNKLMQVDTEQKSVSSRLFLNSIKGLNKIFAFMKTGNKQTMAAIQAKVEMVYKTFHKTQNTKAKVQLLLFLFQSCSHLKGTITDRFYRVLYEFLNTNEILNCSIAQMFFDLLLLSMKQDQNMNRTLAFIKRLLQLCFEAQSNFIATCLILINKVILEKQSIRIMMKQKQNILQDTEQTQTQNGQTQITLPYDMNKRQPLFAGAQKTNIWQLTVLKNHYHPTVRKFTQHILKNQQIPYEGSNPLLQLSLTSFVQKMSLRKQKKSDSWKLKVKRNLQRIRTSKYESILQKPLDSFKQNEQFIKKYLQKREVIYKNKKAMQPEDIEQFADQVIERQMDRLNPKEDNFDDLSISQQQLDQEQEFPQQGEQLPQQDGQVPQEDLQDQEMDGMEGDEDLDGQQDFEGNDDFEGQYDQNEDQLQNEQFGSDQQGYGQQLEDQQMDSQDMEQEESQMGQGDKQFEDVFDDIGDEPQYPKKKKSINKPNKNNKKQKQNHKKITHKQKKKQFKSSNKKNFKNNKRR